MHTHTHTLSLSIVSNMLSCRLWLQVEANQINDLITVFVSSILLLILIVAMNRVRPLHPVWRLLLSVCLSL